mgnify:CR=1 FL=1
MGREVDALEAVLPQMDQLLGPEQALRSMSRRRSWRMMNGRVRWRAVLGLVVTLLLVLSRRSFNTEPKQSRITIVEHCYLDQLQFPHTVNSFHKVYSSPHQSTNGSMRASVRQRTQDLTELGDK